MLEAPYTIVVQTNLGPPNSTQSSCIAAFQTAVFARHLFKCHVLRDEQSPFRVSSASYKSSRNRRNQLIALERTGVGLYEKLNENILFLAVVLGSGWLFRSFFLCCMLVDVEAGLNVGPRD